MEQHQQRLAESGGKTTSDDLVDPFVCLTIPVYSLQDCIFAARASAAKMKSRIVKLLVPFNSIVTTILGLIDPVILLPTRAMFCTWDCSVPTFARIPRWH